MVIMGVRKVFVGLGKTSLSGEQNHPTFILSDQGKTICILELNKKYHGSKTHTYNRSSQRL